MAPLLFSGGVMSDFERFRTMAVEDQVLLERLLAETDQDCFVDAVTRAAAELDLGVTPEEVRVALQAASRSWIARQAR
ncbi:MAG TPA: hypothetical protein VMS37_13045 [Verrucomicrobiae bacterium]|nr:hypothetical protein [Verrucomicrobiae bacterium]